VTQDHNGFTNGSYDWMDINLGQCAMHSSVMLGMIGAALACALRMIRGSDERRGR
jgi:hypothetical protein